MVGTASYSASFCRLLISFAIAGLCECRSTGTSHHLRKSVRAHSLPAAPAPKACSRLKNQETYFTVDIEIGTPGQTFSVVADTGSNTLIVPSCMCQEAGKCSQDDRCFVGTNRSSTFKIPGGPEHARSVYLTFGSGDIGGIIVQDYARVGQLATYMKDGIMLMTDKALDFGGSFEGILGLGLPNPKYPPAAPAQQDSAGGGMDISDAIKRIVNRIAGAQGPEGAPEADASSEETTYLQPKRAGHLPDGRLPDGDGGAVKAPPSQPPGLLEEAGIGRFSMCFNYADDGVLRLGTPPTPGAHSSIGRAHWGLELHGVSVGDSSVPVRVCSPEDALPGQTSSCGAIPDSGTTFIMAPADDLSELLGTLCDEWPRCSRNHSALVKAAQAASEAAAENYGFDPFGIVPASKDQVMKLLLMDCERWLDESGGLDELPNLHFHVQGSGGTKQTLSLPPRAYIVQSDVNSSLMDELNVSTDMTKVCHPGLGAMDYSTAESGPVWILGTPLFYEFTVGYDLSTKPPSISFTSADTEPCGSCDKKAGLLTSDSPARRTNRPRWITGPPRLPSSIDLNGPL